MNNKGQSLVIFILVLPLFFTIVFCIKDLFTVRYEKNKLRSLAQTSILYVMKDDKSYEDVRRFINSNDKDIDILDIGNTSITLKKDVPSVFSNIVRKNYSVKITMNGRYENNLSHLSVVHRTAGNSVGNSHYNSCSDHRMQDW